MGRVAFLGGIALATASMLIAAPLTAQEAWRPPEPTTDADDWIRFSSGEWLRGDIRVLRDDVLEFESEELDELEIDWDDVAELRSARVLTYTFVDIGVVSGTAVMRDTLLVIRTEREEREFPRSALLTIIEGEPTEWNFWSLKVSLGFIGRRGNTDQQDLNTVALLRRTAPRTRLFVDYQGNFSETNDVKTLSNHRVSATFDYILTRGFFITPVAGEYYKDKFANIDPRWTIAAGVGVFLSRKSSFEWWVQVYGGYQSTSFASTEPGEDEQENSAAAIPSTSIELDITGALELLFNYRSQVTIPDAKGTTHHTFALLSYELLSVLTLDTSLTWDRVENPKRDNEGNVPKRDDFRLYFGIGLDI
ncbi:MAG: DUF481 domain-containing protein [Gemmatimonadales bacterium]|jgi:hypothetical protein